MKQSAPTRVIFVTGTDTGAGKTLLTGLLLSHLRQSGSHALALKPFCSGGTGDVDLLGRLQDDELSAREVNPFYFAEPVAPLVAARQHSRRIHLAEVVRHAQAISRRCECLLIEGSGGLLAPLGEGFSALDLIHALRAQVIIAARNRLGVINHARLTLAALGAAYAAPARLVLMGTRTPDASVASNARLLRELAAPAKVFGIDFLPSGAHSVSSVRRVARRFRHRLASILRMP